MRFFALICFLLFSLQSVAQEDLQAFKGAQLSSPRVSQAMMSFKDSARRLFESQGLNFPPNEIYLRSFKSCNEMELWGRNNEEEEFKKVKTYRVCALSGLLGPKRFEGDRQVPEGLYFIDEFNPRSEYYLSLLINYPNYSDVIMGERRKLGGEIYIHGGCVTVGCLPMTDDFIQELYVICLSAKLNGQNNIPVHIFPTRFDQVGVNYLAKSYKGDESKQTFWTNLKNIYDYFETNHKLMPVMYSADGKYISN